MNAGAEAAATAESNGEQVETITPLESNDAEGRLHPQKDSTFQNEAMEANATTWTIIISTTVRTQHCFSSFSKHGSTWLSEMRPKPPLPTPAALSHTLRLKITLRPSKLANV